MICYRVFRAQADWTLTHTSHKDTEQHNRSFCNTRCRNTDWLTDQVINEWMTFSFPGDTTVSADKMFWASNKPAQWTLCILRKSETLWTKAEKYRRGIRTQGSVMPRVVMEWVALLHIGPGFKSEIGDQLSWPFQADAGIFPQFKSQPLPSRYFPIHDSLTIQTFHFI
jgi:hypothetical protein